MVASLVQTYVVEPASKILDATAVLANRSIELFPTDTSILSSPSIQSFLNRAIFRTVSEVGLKPHLARITTPLHRVSQNDLYHLLRDDLSSSPPTPPFNPAFFSANQGKELKLWLEQT